MTITKLRERRKKIKGNSRTKQSRTLKGNRIYWTRVRFLGWIPNSHPPFWGFPSCQILRHSVID